MRVLRWLVVPVLGLCPLYAVYAESLQSPSYRIDESFIGGGGDVNSSSPNYKSDAAVGEVGVGTSASTNFQTHR
jgi:hypothetical protein